MDTGKIFLARLPRGLFGNENSYLLGTLLISKFQQIAMSRQAQQINARRDFWLYIDEFANFITPSMAEILSEARKYRIGLTLAHHNLQQLQRNPEVASAVMAHPFTRIVFKVGDDDAKKIAEGFSYFEAKDLRNLEAGQAVARVDRSDFDFNLSVPLPASLDATATAARRQEVITVSRKKYSTARAEIEAMLAKSRESVPTVAPPTSPPAKPVAELPKVAEVPKAEAPQPIIESEPPAVAEIPKPKEEPEIKARQEKDLGRGGALHKSIQERIKIEAHKLGFIADVEERVNQKSNQAADLVLQCDGIALAVEIAVSTSVTHEFENVQKCLAAGFARLAVITPRAGRLEEIAAAVKAGLGPEAAAKVSYHTADDFIAHLQKLSAEIKSKPTPPTVPGERISHGLRVRRHAPQQTPEEQKTKEDMAHGVMLSVLKP